MTCLITKAVTFRDKVAAAKRCRCTRCSNHYKLFQEETDDAPIGSKQAQKLEKL